METILIKKADRKEWFNRPCGAREVLRLAFPIMLSMCSVSIMTLTDRLCLSWYDLYEMNAAFQAGCLFWTCVVFPTGIGNFVNTFVSQYNGANQKDRIGAIVWQGVFVGALAGLILLAATPLIGPFFRLCGAETAASILEQKYWFYISLGAIASVALEPMVSFFNGIYKTKLVMRVTIVGFLINIVLDPILIFGIGGHCRLGLVGAAIATSIALWTKFIIFLRLFLKETRTTDPKDPAKTVDVYGIRKGFRFCWAEMKRLLRFGTMSASQMTVEHAFFMLFVLIMGKFGLEASASNAIAFSLNGFLYMPAVGIALATAAIVGNQVGAKRYDLAVRATRTSLGLGTCVAGFFAILFIGCPQIFVDLYSLGDPEGFEKVRPLALNVVRIVGFYLIFDALNLIFTASLRGAGDAKFIMLATFAVVLPTVVALLIGVALGLRVYYCWWIQTGYLVVLVLIFFTRFRKGKWREHDVINVKLT